MPKTEIGFHSLSELLMMLCKIFALELCLKSLKDIGWDNKETIFIFVGLIIIFHTIWQTWIFWLWSEVGEYLERSWPYIFVDSFCYFLHVLLLFFIHNILLFINTMNFLRYSLIALKLVAMPLLFWGGARFSGWGPVAFLRIAEMSKSIKNNLSQTQ